MDLKDVIASVKEMEAEANLAFHAGHHDEAENYLGQIRTVIQAYFGELDPYAGNVEKPTTIENAQSKTDETPAQVPDHSEGQALPASQFLAEKAGQVIQSEKPNQ